MQYMKVVDFINKYFAKDLTAEPPIMPPCRSTVCDWIEKGEVPGKQIGSSWFVDEQAWLLQNDPISQQSPQALANFNRIINR